MTEQLKLLLERVEKAKGPDREIDGALYVEFYVDDFRPVAFKTFEPKFHAVHKYHDGWLVGKDNSDVWAENLPRFTSSIDASLRLVQLALPGAEFSITNLYRVAMVEMPLNGHDGWETARREDCNIPLTILAALLRAKIAEQPK